MKLLNIILSFISAMVVLLAIVFEGKIKSQQQIKLNFRFFKDELRLVTPFGWLLISLMLLLSLGNNFLLFQDKKAQETKFTADTLKYAEIITHLENKRIQDSIEIQDLKYAVINNGLKSDAIRIQVVENAVDAINEQRLLLERKKRMFFYK